jgi:hypothetical protein
MDKKERRGERRGKNKMKKGKRKGKKEKEGKEQFRHFTTFIQQVKPFFLGVS